MEFILGLWHTYLYVPLLNLLIWLYVNYAWFNLGLAIILLTVLVRIVLLPFTILDERGKLVYIRLQKDIDQINTDFAKDPIKRKLAIRMLLRKRKIRPWAKAVVLGFQFLVLVLLYQVFIDGLSATKLHLLYPGFPAPDFIYTGFLWFDIAEKNLLVSAIVAGYFFVETYLTHWDRQHKLTRQEQLYMIFFPAFLFLILAILPSVKAVFILTSLVFSTIISVVTTLIKLSFSQAKPHASAHTAGH